MHSIYHIVILADFPSLASIDFMNIFVHPKDSSALEHFTRILNSLEPTYIVISLPTGIFCSRFSGFLGRKGRVAIVVFGAVYTISPLYVDLFSQTYPKYAGL